MIFMFRAVICMNDCVINIISNRIILVVVKSPRDAEWVIAENEDAAS